MTAPTCRYCKAELTHTLVDLGQSPLANSYVPANKADEPQVRYPLHARVCETCWLVQVDDVVAAGEIFSSNYAYFSSFSESWLAHCKAYAEKMISELALGSDSLVYEIASNDGYLLQYFVQAGVPALGIEPSGNTAEMAVARGVPTLVEFFSEGLAKKLASEGQKPDLIASANVLAHVPDIGDFVRGVSVLLTGDAVYTVEFPHLLNLIKDVQFDTIYHEHYSYLSLVAVEKIFCDAGLRVYSVENLSTHGGSLRIYACLKSASHIEQHSVARIREIEAAAGMDELSGYADFTSRVQAIRDSILAFLMQARSDGKLVAAYGAAAKGNTLLNYCGIGPDLVAFCVDKNPAKQNTLLPGSLIPVKPVEALMESDPDYVFILPWNLKEEVVGQLNDRTKPGTKFVTAIPEVKVSN